MPNIRTFDAPIEGLHPSEAGSAAFREAGAVASRMGQQAAEQTRLTGQAFGNAIAGIGRGAAELFGAAQDHTDQQAELDYAKNSSANDLAALDAIQGVGTGAKDENGNPAPSTARFTTGSSSILDQYQQTQEAELERARANGASDKALFRIQEQQAARYRSIALKAHSESIAVAGQEALGNIQRATNTSAALIDRHPEMLDSELARFDQTVSAASMGIDKLEAKRTIGPQGNAAKAALITAGVLSYAKSGQLDQVDRILKDPKYDQYIGAYRETIENKVSAVTQARIRDQNAVDAAKEKEIGGQQDALVDQIYRNSLLPPEKQDPNLSRKALEVSPLFAGRPTDLQKARATLDQLQRSTTDPAVSQRIADGISRGITSGQITTPAQIDAAYDPLHPEKSLTWQDRTRLQGELKDAIDNPATKAFHGEINDWLKRNEGQIDGSFDPAYAASTRTALGQQMIGRWEAEVKRRAQIMRQKGQDPHELLDPNSPNSMVSPQALAPYRVTAQMSSQYNAQQAALDKNIEAQRAAGQAPTGAIPVPKALEAIPGLMRNKATGQFYDPAKKQFYNADGTPAKMNLQAPQPQKMNFAPEAQPTGAQSAINAALSLGVDAHLDKNLFSSGRAQEMGIKGGVGQNLTQISVQGHAISVNVEAAPHFKAFLDELTARGYKINELGGYSDRMKRGSFTSVSEHAYGNAIDINEARNKFRTHKTDLPPDIAQIAAKYGLIWGGNWRGSSADPMHFEWSGKGGATRFAGAQ